MTSNVRRLLDSIRRDRLSLDQVIDLLAKHGYKPNRMLRVKRIGLNTVNRLETSVIIK
jgi:hypothetical protein